MYKRQGLGIGDNKYQENLPNYSNSLEEVIGYLFENFELSKDSRSLFLGGNSNENIRLMKKYSIGINQWLGSIKQIYKTRDVYKKIKNPKGSISLCLNKDFSLENEIIFDDIELIYIIRESSTEDYRSQLDHFFK